MNYYYFHIGDYRKDTTHLTPEEHYIYRTLIDWYFLDEKPIPLKTQTVSRRLQIKTEWLIYLENVLQDFFEKTEKGWIHRRIEVDIKDYEKKCEHNRQAGKLGGRPKKTQVVSKNNPSVTLTNNQEPITNKKHTSSYDDYFLKFWNMYPKKVGKGEAWKIWKRLKISNQTEILIKIKTALIWQKISQQWQGGYIPNPATYLNQSRWDDEPEDKSKPNGSIPRFVPPTEPRVGWWSSEDRIEAEAKKYGIRMNPLLSNAQICWQINEVKKEDVERSK